MAIKIKCDYCDNSERCYLYLTKDYDKICSCDNFYYKYNRLVLMYESDNGYYCKTIISPESDEGEDDDYFTVKTYY